MKLTMTEEYAIERALNIWNYKNDVFIEQTNHFEAGLKGEPIIWGVNWSCKGPQSVEETIKYTKAMTKAAQIATALNALEITIDSDAEPYDRETACELADRISDELDRDPYFGITESAISGPIVKYRIG